MDLKVMRVKHVPFVGKEDSLPLFLCKLIGIQVTYIKVCMLLFSLKHIRCLLVKDIIRVVFRLVS